MSKIHSIRVGQILTGLLFSEPIRVETVCDNGGGTWSVGLVGTQSDRFRKVTLTIQDLEAFTILDASFSYEGGGRLLRLGLQAYSLGIAWEFDPYFGLSISRVYSLQHEQPSRLDFYRAKVVDGLGNEVHERLFAVELNGHESPLLREPNMLVNFSVADPPKEFPQAAFQPELSSWLYENALQPFLEEIRKERLAEVERIADHIEFSLTELLQRADTEIGKAQEALDRNEQGAEGRLVQAENRRDCYWLYVVTNCADEPALQEPIRDPARFPWHEVKKVQHYWLEVDAMTQPMKVRQNPPPPYGDKH